MTTFFLGLLVSAFCGKPTPEEQEWTYDAILQLPEPTGESRRQLAGALREQNLHCPLQEIRVSDRSAADASSGWYTRM